MHNLEEYEENLVRMSVAELNIYMFTEGLLSREQKCEGTCGCPLKYTKCKNYSDFFCWRCVSVDCSAYQKRISIRKNSFFEDFNCEIKTILKVLLRWSIKQSQVSILKSISISKPTFRKILGKLNILMQEANLKEKKLGGPGTIIQVDETMMNFKCKSHRGRNPENRTDALCIVECSPHIIRVWAQTIADKRALTILPIIVDRVLPGSLIYTDEHRSYTSLSKIGFLHESVCHKYSFVNPENGVHTQHVEAFNNVIKCEIKKRMGIATFCREKFLTEIVWMWNNKKNLFAAVLNLIKI